MHTEASRKTVIIVGAGPAGLTAALELLRNTHMRVVVLEELDDVGGISRTIDYKGNRMDIGGHRFFSKNAWVMDWWKQLLPIADDADTNGVSLIPTDDSVLLVRSRLSRIYYLRKFFDYPISLSMQTMSNLGLWRLIKIGTSYLQATAFPRRKEKNLEDFFCNRFGQELYKTFFKDYTEKVWGVACRNISSEWGAQRIKGLSIRAALTHALKKLASPQNRSVSQTNVETSLIEKFLYPKLGPGQMWNAAADEIRSLGGEIHFSQKVVSIQRSANQVTDICSQDRSGQRQFWQGDYFISSMPIKDLVAACSPPAPMDVVAVARGLVYRDFITIGLKLKKLKPAESCAGPLNLLPDTWIYIQEPDVKIGRLQIFNNWSPALVSDAKSVWLGLEYFCQEGDSLWSLPDRDFANLAIGELTKINLIESNDALDYHVVRVPKAYPAYFGSYDKFESIRQWTDSLSNLFLIGRNGMHRYNNQDHSMLTAKIAAKAIWLEANHKEAKQALWSVNVEQEYHEETKR